MKMESIVLTPKSGGDNIVYHSTNNAGLMLDIKEGGVLISTTDQSNGWRIIAFHTADTIAVIVPRYTELK